jgi:hypothetical protein
MILPLSATFVSCTVLKIDYYSPHDSNRNQGQQGECQRDEIDSAISAVLVF